tara:strand:+ start:3548 stop:3964 length:417 start_codon:yes stop_codon:yes gene_type:complete
MNRKALIQNLILKKQTKTTKTIKISNMQKDLKKLNWPSSSSSTLNRTFFPTKIRNTFKATRKIVMEAIPLGKAAAPIGSYVGSGSPLALIKINTPIINDRIRKLISYLSLNKVIIGLSRELCHKVEARAYLLPPFIYY